MKLVVFFRSSKPPYNLWRSGVADGHCAIRSGWCMLHIWRTCSVVWSSSPQGHVGEGTIFNFLCMCALSLLWPKRSRAKTNWPGLSRRWYASFSFLGFSAVLMMVVFSYYETILIVRHVDHEHNCCEYKIWKRETLVTLQGVSMMKWWN